MACKEVDYRVVADEEKGSEADIAAAVQPDNGQEANYEEGGNGSDSQSYTSPTELTSLEYLNK